MTPSNAAGSTIQPSDPQGRGGDVPSTRRDPTRGPAHRATPRPDPGGYAWRRPCVGTRSLRDSDQSSLLDRHGWLRLRPRVGPVRSRSLAGQNTRSGTRSHHIQRNQLIRRGRNILGLKLAGRAVQIALPSRAPAPRGGGPDTPDRRRFGTRPAAGSRSRRGTQGRPASSKAVATAWRVEPSPPGRRRPSGSALPGKRDALSGGTPDADRAEA